MVEVGLKLMYTAWCCPGRCTDLKNAWLKLIIPLPLFPALPPTPLLHFRRWIMEEVFVSLTFNNGSVVELLFCTIFHETHYVPCL